MNNVIEDPHYPDVISFASDIKFFIVWLKSQVGTYRNASGHIEPSYAYKGCISKANIIGFELEDAKLIAFMSLIESFLKNQLNTSKETKLLNITAKVITTNGEALLQLTSDNVKKTITKATCNYILRCYQAITKEYNLYFVSSSPTKTV